MTATVLERAPATDRDLQRAGIGELEPLEGVRHSPAEVAECLAALALEGGDSRRAEAALRARGLAVDHTTLHRWRSERFPNRYRAACVELAPQIERAVLDSWRALAIKATQVSFKAAELEEQRIEAGDIKDAASSARNLATVAGIAVDKIMNMTNRPTQIVEHRTADQALRRLEALAATVEGTAVELGGEEGGGGVDA